MRIAFLAPYHPFRGGIAQITAIFANYLKQRHHDVHVFSFIKQYPNLIFPGKDQFSRSNNPIPVSSSRVLTPYFPWTWISTFVAIKKWKPDVLIIKYWIPFFAPAYCFIALLCKHFTNTTIVFNTDNIVSHEKWPIGTLLTKLALKQSDYILTLSQNVTESAYKLLPNYPKKNIITGLHPNYNYYKHFEIQDREKLRDKYHITAPKVILFFGFIKKYKGLDILLEAMPRILSYIPDIQLLIAGEVYGDAVPYYELIKRKDLEANVRFEERFIKDEEVKEIFAISDVAVQPYRSATQSGISQVAFSLNTPIIATNVGGLHESILHEKNGLLAEPESPLQLADSVIRFYKEKMQCKMEVYIENSKDKFSWKPLIKIVENLEKKS